MAGTEGKAYVGKFKNQVEYDMFAAYWRYLCAGINPETVNGGGKVSIRKPGIQKLGGVGGDMEKMRVDGDLISRSALLAEINGEENARADRLMREWYADMVERQPTVGGCMAEVGKE